MGSSPCARPHLPEDATRPVLPRSSERRAGSNSARRNLPFSLSCRIWRALDDCRKIGNCLPIFRTIPYTPAFQNTAPPSGGKEKRTWMRTRQPKPARPRLNPYTKALTAASASSPGCASAGATTRSRVEEGRERPADPPDRRRRLAARGARRSDRSCDASSSCGSNAAHAARRRGGRRRATSKRSSPCSRCLRAWTAIIRPQRAKRSTTTRRGSGCSQKLNRVAAGFTAAEAPAGPEPSNPAGRARLAAERRSDLEQESASRRYPPARNRLTNHDNLRRLPPRRRLWKASWLLCFPSGRPLLSFRRRL